MKPGFLGVVAAIASMTGASPRALSAKTIAHRRAQQAAWRRYEPRPIAIPQQGPRPASTYRAARRNARRNPFSAGAA